MALGLWYARGMSLLDDQRSTGGRTPFLIGAQLGLLLLVTPCAITPSFEGMFSDLSCCLPLVTELVMNPSYGVVGGLLVLGMLARAFTQRERLARPGLLAWSAVLLGAFLVVLYVFGLYAPMRPL
jgi:hypothetical protein